MYIFNKIKSFFLTLLSSIIIGTCFFILSTIALITSWIVFIAFSLTTIYINICEIDN